MIRKFTEQDIVETDRLYVKTSELLIRPLWWHKRGLQQTSSGYGRKLTTRYMLWFEGRLRRVYVTCFSNNGTAWFTYKKGQKIVVNYGG